MLKQRFELVPGKLPLCQAGMLAVDANLTFFSGLTEHEVLSLDPLVDRFRAVHNLSGLPGGLVQVLVRLQTTTPASGPEC